MSPGRIPWLVVGPLVAVAGALAAAAAPLPVVLGAARLAPLLVLGCGAWLSVRRLGVVDLGTGAAAAAGAYAGAVWPAVTGTPVWLGVPLGVVAGAAVGAVSAATAARVGRVGSAVSTLALAAALTGLPVAWAAAGGASGFHAVPLLTGSDRGDLVVLLAGAAAAAALCAVAARRPAAAMGRAAVVAAPVVAAAGARPSLTAARPGAVAGGLLGLGGVLVGTASGSVAPAAFGLTLSATLALSALVGGGHALGGMVGAGLLYGPAVVWPTAPVLGDAPLLVLAPLALGLLALRPGGVLPGTPLPPPPAAPGDAPVPAAPAPRLRPAALRLERLPTVPGGGALTVAVEPGQIVALAGPNGAGKSTVLARVGGQLPDGGRVTLGDRGLQRGAIARASDGIARTWQRPRPEASGQLLAAVTSRDPAARVAAGWARHVLGALADTPLGLDLQLLAAQRPRVALLDEPGAHGDVAAVEAFLRGLADAGCAVLVVEHRPELVDAADHVVRLGGGDG